MQPFRETCTFCGASLNTVKFNGYYIGGRDLEDVYFYIDVPSSDDGAFDLTYDDISVADIDKDYFERYDTEYFFDKFIERWETATEPADMHLECTECDQPLELMPPELDDGEIFVSFMPRSDDVTVYVKGEDAYQFDADNIEKYTGVFDGESVTEAVQSQYAGMPVPDAMRIAAEKALKH